MEEQAKELRALMNEDNFARPAAPHKTRIIAITKSTSKIDQSV